MDSVNLSETQSTPLNFRSTASNTSPILCACCGLKNYAQTVPQAYYFRALCPGLSKDKHCQDDAEEKFPLQHQFFAGLPSLLPPFFYNNAIPTNSCCSRHHLNKTTASEQQKQQANERDKIPLFTNQYFCQKEKCEKENLRMNNTATEEVKKNNNTFEEQFLSHPFFVSLPETQLNTFFHRCGCGDSISWPCSPFILPVISYGVFWNSQKSSLGILSGNYSGISPETVRQKNNDNPENQKNSHCEEDKETFTRNLDEDFNNNFTETADCEEEECLSVTTVTRNDWEKGRHLDLDQNEYDCLKSSAFNSSDISTESAFKNAGQMDNDNTRYTVKGSDDIRIGKDEEDEDEEDEEEEDTEAYDSAGHERSDECLKLDENDLPDLTTNLYFSNEPCNTSLNENESQPSSATGSLMNLKEAGKNAVSATDFSSADTKANPSDISAEGERAFRSRISNRNIQEKISDNECERKTPEMKATHFKKPISIKKFIKNFTMTDHTNSVHEEAQNSAAAAGDLGGDNCVGYKVNILKSFEEDQQYKILQETQTEENFQSKTFVMKGLSDLEEHQPESYSEKSTVKNSKSPRNFKSGIAKLSYNSKLKESKGDAEKKINYNKELSQRELPVIKRKHSCFPNDNTASISDYGSKIQKTRNHGVVQQQSQGPEKQYRATCNRIEPLKKEEKISKVKTPAHNSNSQKLSKDTRKK